MSIFEICGCQNEIQFCMETEGDNRIGRSHIPMLGIEYDLSPNDAITSPISQNPDS